MESLNGKIFDWIFGFAHRSMWLDQLGIFLADYLAYILILSALVLIFTEPGWKRRIFFFSQMVIVFILGRGILVEAIHFFYPVLRPFDALGFTPLVPESGSAFPSGHATMFFGLAVVMFYINKKWGVWYFILAALMAVARVFAGVHWPFDVIAGALIGTACGILVHYLVEAYFKKIEIKDPENSEN